MKMITIISDRDEKRLKKGSNFKKEKKGRSIYFITLLQREVLKALESDQFF